jgi:hypothetical protein
VDGLDKVTGRAACVADVGLPGMLSGAVVRSLEQSWSRPRIHR